MCNLDLILDNGELVKIEFPDEFIDDVAEALENCMKRRDFWSPSQFEGCKADYIGHSLDRVNMNKVVGMM